MLRRTVVSAVALSALAFAAVAAYIPRHDLKIDRDGGAFVITGKNNFGDVNVKVEDKNLFQGFRAEGKNGDRQVLIDVKSAGLGAGWKLEGKVGEERINGTCKQDGAFASTWTVKGKFGDREVEAKVDDEWDIDPAAQAVLVFLDFSDLPPKSN